MNTVSTHVLDTANGCPAPGINVVLARAEDDRTFRELARGTTDHDGRVRDLVSAIEPGTYRITFEVGPYHTRLGVKAFYPEVQVSFVVAEMDGHYHIPLLLSPFGYSTYRGS